LWIHLTGVIEFGLIHNYNCTLRTSTDSAQVSAVQIIMHNLGCNKQMISERLFMQRDTIQSIMLTLLVSLSICSTSFCQSRKVCDIKPPDGYSLVTLQTNSYSQWISRLPLRKGNEIAVYTGDTLFPVPYHVYAVIDMPLLFRQDLEQCADWAFRFWAEYHRDRDKLNKLFLMDYNGRPRPFSQSKKSFKQFFKWTVAHANSYSIKTGAIPVSEGAILPGDMVVQNEKGGIGHVSIIMNVAASKSGDTLLLIGFSFMPAQEFHIEKAQPRYGTGGWFTLEGFSLFLAENLDLGDPVLRRFKGS
jgi:hypothetical protein